MNVKIQQTCQETPLHGYIYTHTRFIKSVVERKDIHRRGTLVKNTWRYSKY